jgi:hypothetical protein
MPNTAHSSWKPSGDEEAIGKDFIGLYDKTLTD